MSKSGRLDLNQIKEILSKTRVIDTPLLGEMSKSFISYAMGTPSCKSARGTMCGRACMSSL